MIKPFCYTTRQLCNNSLYKSIFVHMFVRTADYLDEGQTPFRAYGPACSNIQSRSIMLDLRRGALSFAFVCFKRLVDSVRYT